MIGVDATDAMLEVARAKVPDADFRRGALEDLPSRTSPVDVVTCALALTHVPTSAGPARVRAVLRPGGTAVLSDIHPSNTLLGGRSPASRARTSPRGSPSS